MRSETRKRNASVVLFTFSGLLFLSSIVFWMIGSMQPSPLPPIQQPQANLVLKEMLFPPTPTPVPTPITTTATLSITGDLMVHEWQLNHAFNKETNEHDFTYAFSHVAPYLRAADFTMGNLETVLGGKDIGYATYPTFNSPDSFGVALKEAGFDFLSTANNHSNDKREKGILRTISQLDSLGISHAGTYSSPEARGEIFMKEINGITFAILSYTYSTNGIPLTPNKPYLVNLLDESLIMQDIARAKALSPDFVIVMPHMGNEYETKTSQIFKDWVQIMLEAGADMVLASHPHVLQPPQIFTKENPDKTTQDCFVAFSMGNFISSQRTIPRDAGAIINMTFSKTEGQKAYLQSVSAIPTWVKFYNAKGKQDITVLSVYDTLKAHQMGENVDLRQKDITRLKTVHKEAMMTFLGKDVPLDMPWEDMQNEYILYTNTKEIE